MEHIIKNTGYHFAWDDSLPIGNGRLGAMIPGVPAIDNELITLNEDSIWCGGPVDRSSPIAKENVQKIRDLLNAGQAEAANRLVYQSMTSYPKYFGPYEPMCDLYLFHKFYPCASNYERVLDMRTGIASVSYEAGGMQVRREHFVSHPDNVIVLHFQADQPRFGFHTHIMRRPYGEPCDSPEPNVVHLHGQASQNGVAFDCMYSVKTDGKLELIGDFFGIQDASEITLYITACTTFYEADPYQKALDQLHAAMAMDYEVLKQRHIADFSAMYDRSCVDFGTSSDTSFGDRLEACRKDDTDIKGLLELFLNYGKYLMISASRPGTQAMNLQGIWNRKFAAEWECNYTVNINTEMNYWIAEIMGLSDCHEPLFALIERMIPNGEITARKIYGCDGFVSHHTTDLWGDTSIEGNSSPAFLWPMGGAWLLLHMWEHYLFTQDREFLEKRAFPLLKKSALFFTQYLTRAEDGCYVTGPSLSPENVYYTDDGQVGKECMAPEIDNQILRALFRAVKTSYEILDCKDADYETYCHFLANLRPSRVNSWGGIMEWDKDYREFDPGHRHLSPLFGLYPDHQISPERTPEIAKACAATLRSRHDNASVVGQGFDGFGSWIAVWASGCYARLEDGEHAMQSMREFLQNSKISRSALHSWPIFQIEGNLGAAAAVCEMLLGSNEDSITLLPALPKELESGSFQGLHARGGFVVDTQWADGKPVTATVTSTAGNPCRIKAAGLCGVNTAFTKDGDYILFQTEKGGVYELSFS